jgi:uncharacterized membrane protein
MDFLEFIGPAFGLTVMFFMVGWYVFIPYMLWMIWQKVRHLPS